MAETSRAFFEEPLPASDSNDNEGQVSESEREDSGAEVSAMEQHREVRARRVKTVLRVAPLLLVFGVVIVLTSAPTASLNLPWVGHGSTGGDVVLFVDSQASTAPEAMQDTSARVAAILENASKHGFKYPGVRTTGVSVLPQTDATGANIAGYRAVNQIIISDVSPKVAQELRGRGAELGMQVLAEPMDAKEVASGGAPSNWNLQWLQFG